MGLEIVYGVGALVLLTALIFATLQYHYRNRRATEAGHEIAQERYRKNQTCAGWPVANESKVYADKVGSSRRRSEAQRGSSLDLSGGRLSAGFFARCIGQ
jgi:hypothetical protein